MARGQVQARGGRLKGGQNAKAGPIAKLPADIRKAARESKVTPLDYMLAVMNDETADDVRRDRMAMAAAPFVHAKPTAEAETGKKAAAVEAAKTAGVGSDWGSDLQPLN